MAIIRNANGLNSYSENNTPTPTGNRKITKKLDLLDQKMNGLYRDIYITRPDNRQNLDSILNRLDDAIDRLQSDETNISGMSELLRRIESKDGSNVKNLMSSVSDLFNNQNLVSTLFANEDLHRYISGQNYQYDLICKYLPKLLDALEIKRDNVLSSDNFSKEFINPKSSRTNKVDLEKFSSNTSKLERVYDISDFFEKTYMNVSKYGEDFIYVVPYHAAFERVIRRSTSYRRNNARLEQFSLYESHSGVECISEGYVDGKEFGEYKSSIESVKGKFNSQDYNNSFKGHSVNLHFNDSGVINEAINERIVIENKQDLAMFESLSSVFESTIGSDSELMKQYKEIDKENNKLSNVATDGLIIPDNLNIDAKKIDKNILGAVVERLPRENVIPIYITDKICMGYYYLEFKEDQSACGYCGGHHVNSTNGLTNSMNLAYDMSEDQQELAIRFIASRMSASIDTHFINANKDLKEEIYAILRYNEKFDICRSNDIGVTFIPAEDIVHCYFDFNEKTHRGISDLEKSVVPAMLYILLYLTDIIGKISRSNDKRIYYVKQNVETNVARTMMNVVQQIKKGNMGMRQIESMNNILNVVGKYNDFIIPLGPSGDPPISFEVMNGQDIQTPTDIMEKMEELAVTGTGIPFEMLNSIYQQDFAVRFSMSNAKLLKHINTRQRAVSKFFSKIYTKIYNYEFNENNSYITIMLPPPLFLVMQNNQQIIDNVTSQADKIIEIELANEEDDVKTEFKKIYVRNHLSTYIDFNSIERFKNAAKVAVETNKVPQVSEDGGDDGGYGDDY